METALADDYVAPPTQALHPAGRGRKRRRRALQQAGPPQKDGLGAAPMGHYTAAPEGNLLGLTDKDALNEQEALGVARVERYMLEDFDYPVDVTLGLLQDLHRRAFGHLYDWAGRGRTQVPNVGAYLPPPANRVPQLLYEFVELRHRQGLLELAPTPSSTATAARRACSPTCWPTITAFRAWCSTGANPGKGGPTI
jgi:hypothetical protein